MERVLAKKQPHQWSRAKIIISTAWGLAFLICSFFINYAAGTYASAKASNIVSDIILDNLPIINVDLIFVNGILLFFLFTIFLLIQRPQRAPFVLKSLSLFIIIRSFFIILTHLAPIPGSIPHGISPLIDDFTFTGDLFFSAHTGFPFLLALIFWPDRPLRTIFICMSLIFGAAVLLGHLHYSIDVFAAFFITYGIFHIAIKLFTRDFKLLRHGLSPKAGTY